MSSCKCGYSEGSNLSWQQWANIQVFNRVENRILALGFEILSEFLFSAYKLSRKKYSGNIYEAVFEKAKDRGGTVNRTSVYARKSRIVLLKRCYEKFCRIHKKRFESLFWCFLVNFAKFIRTSFLSNSTGLLLLIIAVSIVTKL